MTKGLALKVRIRNAAGQYLAGDPSNFTFSWHMSQAVVFDYHGHRVAEQLEFLRASQGLALEVVPVDPREVYETCDRCERLMTSPTAFFDGARFYCPDCRTGASRPAPRAAKHTAKNLPPNSPKLPPRKRADA
jgi:hypothetical protein